MGDRMSFEQAVEVLEDWRGQMDLMEPDDYLDGATWGSVFPDTMRDALRVALQALRILASEQRARARRRRAGVVD